MSRPETPSEYAARTTLVELLRSARESEAEEIFAAVHASNPQALPTSAHVGPSTQANNPSNQASVPTISATDTHVAPAGDVAGATSDFKHSDRLRGKVLQLARMDRPRPPPSSTTEQRSLQRRLTRVQHKRKLEGKQEQVDWNAELAMLEGRTKGHKKRNVDRPTKRTSTAKVPTKLSTSDMRSMTTDTLLDQTHAVWVEYMQDLLRMREPGTVRSLSLVAEQQALAPSSPPSTNPALVLPGPRPPVPDGTEEGSSTFLGMPSNLSGGAATTLSKADWTGAAVYVVDSTCADMRGIRGIVLSETEHTLVLGTPHWMDAAQPIARPIPAGGKRKQKKKSYPIVRRTSLFFFLFRPQVLATEELTSFLLPQAYPNTVQSSLLRFPLHPPPVCAPLTL